jgi:hypothetical protein
MASGMSTESSTGLHGIEHGLDERLRGVPLRQPDRGRAARPWDGLWPLGIKKEGPPAAPLFEREFGQAISERQTGAHNQKSRRSP